MKHTCMRMLLALIGLSLLSAVRAQMLAPGAGLRGALYATPDLSGPAVVKYAVVDLAWKEDAGPVAEMKPGAFSAQWRGYLLPAFSETYTFTVTTAGGVRLLVNGTRLIDNWAPHPAKADSGTITLTAGKLTPIVLQTTQPAGAGSIKLQWSSKSQPAAAIPIARLYPPLFSPVQLIYAESADARSNSALYLTELDGTPKKFTVDGSSQPVISPDGKWVIFSTVANMAYTSAGIYHLGINGRNLNQLTGASGGNKFDPAFSVDGYTILYVAKAAGAWEIWTMRADGGRRVRLLESPVEVRHPLLTPDGTFVIYQAKKDGQWNLFRVKADGTEETALTTEGGSEPVINRRGDLVVFVSSRAGTPQLFQMKPDGTEQKPLVTTTGAVSQPFFDRSGTRLGYLERDAKGNSNLYLLDLADGIPCQVTATGKCQAAAMTPLLLMPASDNLALWLNAQQDYNMQLDDQRRVAAWNDASLRGIVATQPNAGERPTFHPDGINNFPTVFFEGNSRLLVPDISAGWPGTDGTLVLLYRPADWGQYTIVHQDNGGGDEYWRYNGNGDGYIGIFRPNRQENYPPAMPSNGVHLLTIISSGTQYTAYLDGVALPPRDTQFLAPTTLTLGTGGGAGYFKGDIAELAIFNRALTTDERVEVENKFRDMYGLN